MSNDNEPGETDSAQSRYWLTNDLLTGFLALSFVGYVVAPMTPYVDAYPEANPVVLATFVGGFGIAIAWAYGPDAVKAWQNFRGE